MSSAAVDIGRFRLEPQRPVHTAEAFLAARRAQNAPAPTTLDEWRALLREAAVTGPCGWCGGDGRGVQVRGCTTLVCSTSGCQFCRGSGAAGDAARRRLMERLGGLLALAAALEAALGHMLARIEADASKPAPVEPAWTHTWAWSKRPNDRDRKGMRCRLVAVGRLGSAEVLFQDGVTHITARRGLRRLGGPRA